MKKLTIFLIVFLFSVAVVSAVSCNDTITSDVTLTGDLSCSGDGLIIDADDITIDCDGNSIIGNNTGNGIYAMDNDNITIKDCLIQNFTNAVFFEGSVVLSGTWTRYPVSSYNLTNNTIKYNDVGIYFKVTNDVYINSNTITDNNEGVKFQDGVNTYINNNILTNNNYGINSVGWVNALFYPNNLFISNNSIEVNNEGIKMLDTRHIVIDCNGNSITGSDTDNGINFTSVYNVTIKDCMIQNFTYGVLSDNSDKASIFNNTVSKNDRGIYAGLTVYSTNHRIENNTFKNNSYAGVSLQRTNSFNVTNNTIHNNVIGIFGYGQYFYSDNHNIERNDIYENTDGINLLGKTRYWSIVNNSVRNNSYAGFQMKGSSGSGNYPFRNLIQDNIVSGNTFGFYVASNRVINVTENTVINNDVGFWYLTNQNFYVYHNNIYNNSNINFHSHYGAKEISYNKEGNYWGKTNCPLGPLFIPGPTDPNKDSNRADAIDSYPYNSSNGWLTSTPCCVDADSDNVPFTNRTDCSAPPVDCDDTDATVNQTIACDVFIGQTNCQQQQLCVVQCPANPAEDCANTTLDEDCDGLIDCEDPDCDTDPACDQGPGGNGEGVIPEFSNAGKIIVTIIALVVVVMVTMMLMKQKQKT